MASLTNRIQQFTFQISNLSNLPSELSSAEKFLVVLRGDDFLPYYISMFVLLTWENDSALTILVSYDPFKTNKALYSNII